MNSLQRGSSGHETRRAAGVQGSAESDRGLLRGLFWRPSLSSTGPM